MSGTIEIKRIFDAPRELVFRAWTTPEHLTNWFAPTGCRLTIKHVDCRTDGTFHTCVHTPDGFNCWCIGEYKEVVEPERIIYNIAVCDEAGNRLSAKASGHDPEWPEETLVRVDFRELPVGRTEMTLAQNVSEELAKRTGAYPSWIDMLDQLEALLTKPM